jgi:tetratricopeptide (TPR) repeat protein
MRGSVLVALALALCPLPPAFAQSPTGTIAQVDARAEVAAVLYAASATQAAAERVADAKLRAQRQEIDGLRAQVRGGAAQLRVALTAAEEEYVAALAARDRAYGQEIAVFRAAVEDIAKTPEGVAALARFNAGDEIGALAVLDDLRAARDAARKKRADIESAAEGRRIATLALEARAKAKLTTAQVITRFEEVTRLDPGVSWDWVELGRLYKDAGKLPDTLRAAEAAADTAANDRDRSAAFIVLGGVQVAQGDLSVALASYRASLAIEERLAQADPGNAQSQRDVAAPQDRIGDVQRTQGNLAAALASYRASFGIRERLTQADPSNAAWQQELSLSATKIGDVQAAQGDLPAALASYRASLAIRERLAKADPGNTRSQWDLAVSHDRIGDMQKTQGDLPAALASYSASLAILERLAQADPGNAEWQRELSVPQDKVGDVQAAQGDLPAALASYRASLATRERMAQADPGNAQWQQDLAFSQEKIGNLQETQGNWRAALASYSASLAIQLRLAKADPGNAEWQRGLIVIYAKLSSATGDKAYAQHALNIALDMQKRGILAPRDAWMIDELKRHADP